MFFITILTGHGELPHPIWKKEVWDTVRSEAIKAHSILGVKETLFREIPAAMVADQPTLEVNKIVDELLKEISPDILYIPFLYDLHGDHRSIVYAACVAWRPVNTVGKGIKEIYMYETLSETHWNIHQLEGGFLPNVFVNIAGPYIEKKMHALSAYKAK